jgi:hypothetical protein
MWKSAATIVIGLVILLATPLASDEVVSHYRRRQASNLLATVHGLQPGVDTEIQTREALKSFSRYEEVSEGLRDGVVVREIDYQFYNGTIWAGRVASYLPFRITLPWTRFAVNLNFVEAFLLRFMLVKCRRTSRA